MAPGKLYAIFAAISWGIQPILSQAALAGTTFRLFMVYAAVSGFLMLIAIGVIQGEQAWFDVPLSAIGIYVVIGVTGSFLGRFFSVKGIEKIGGARSNSVVNSSPLLTALYAVFLLGERLTPAIAAGVFFILFGTYTISNQRSGTGPRSFRFIDVLWSLGAALCYSFDPVLKRLVMLISNTPLVGIAYSHGTSTLIFIGSFLMQRAWGDLRATAPRHHLMAIVSGCLGSFGGYMTFLAIQNQPILIVSSIWRVSPLVSLIASYLFLRSKEVVTLRDVLGTCAIVGGVLILIRLA